MFSLFSVLGFLVLMLRNYHVEYTLLSFVIILDSFHYSLYSFSSPNVEELQFRIHVTILYLY